MAERTEEMDNLRMQVLDAQVEAFENKKSG